MDEHIARGTTSNNNSNDDNHGQIPSPAELFNDFCKKCVGVLKTEIDRLVDLEEFSEDPSLIIPKIKKTYKNRAFQFLK